MYIDRLELGFMFKKNDFVYVVMDANLPDHDDSADGIAIVTCWYHTVRLATKEEQITYEVMRS